MFWTLEFLEKSHASFPPQSNSCGIDSFRNSSSFWSREIRGNLDRGIISFPPGTFLSSVWDKVGEEGEITRSFVRGKDNFGHFRIQSVSERNRRNREDVGFHRVSERRSVREYKSGHPVHGGAPTHVSTRVYVCVYLPVSVHGSVIRGGSRAAE